MACVAGKLGCVMELALAGCQYAVTVLPAHTEREKLQYHVLDFLGILRNDAPLISARLRLALAFALVHRRAVLPPARRLALDIVRLVGRALTGPRLARSMYSEREFLDAQADFCCSEGAHPSELGPREDLAYRIERELSQQQPEPISPKAPGIREGTWDEIKIRDDRVCLVRFVVLLSLKVLTVSNFANA